ncbi:MAG: protoporphyrinogen oxidase [Acidobacteria bacterium]|nr:protoporphyrinogen oxidase [Acidobacteriota bacterium]
MSERKILILGGGLTGLATAYYLATRAREAGAGLSLTVLEASDRWGGKIVSERAGGFLIEGGPDSFITRKPWALELIRELGLDDQVIETPPASGKVFLLRGGRPVELPEGMVFVVPTLEEPFLDSEVMSEEGKRRVLAEVDVPPRSETGDESLADFLRRRFGPEALDRLGQPLMAGIHAADPERLSLAAAFPEMATMETRFGSLIRGLRQVHRGSGLAATKNSSRVSLRGGIGQLADTLAARLAPGTLQLGRAAASLERGPEGFLVRDRRGGWWPADAVVIALPAFAASELVAELAPELAKRLGEIRYVSTATVSLGFRRQDVTHPLEGLGVVFPTAEGRDLQACTWSSSKFAGRAPESDVLIRAFVGGAGAEHLLDQDDEALVSLALDELTPLLGLGAPPHLMRVYRWPQGIPQFEIGHRARVESIAAAGADGLFLAGNAYQGLGLPDAVRSAREAADAALGFACRAQV